MPCSTNFPFGNKSADINGWPIQFSDLAQLKLYADRVGATGSGIPASVLEVVIASLATNRITYCKSTQGDCGGPTPQSLGTGASALNYTSQGLKTASSFVTAGSVAGTAFAPVTLGLSLIGIPLLGIFRHHAQAVAREHQTLCQVADAWNQFAFNMEAQLRTGKTQRQDAEQALSQVHDQLVGALSGIEKPPFNAAMHYHKALDALLVFNKEVVIPKFSGGVLSGWTGKLLVGGAIVGGAKLAGAF